MCTLTYVSSESGKIIITSNRDEDPERPTSSNLQLKKHNNLKILLPVDQVAGGSWISCAQNGQIRCLLNGAFEKHKFNPPYKTSRGLVLLESLHYSSLRHFQSAYDFQCIQPFTLVGFNTTNRKLEEIRFTGEKITYKSLNPELPHIWSAAQLYSSKNIHYREKLFSQFIEDCPRPTSKDLLNFHSQSNLTDPDKGFIINRDERVKTVSITQVSGSDQKLEMIYRDLETKLIDQQLIQVESGELN